MLLAMYSAPILLHEDNTVYLVWTTVIVYTEVAESLKLVVSEMSSSYNSLINIAIDNGERFLQQ